MVNICEPLINVVNVGKRKVLIRSEPKGEWSGTGVVVSSGADVAPPANRWDRKPAQVCTYNVVSTDVGPSG